MSAKPMKAPKGARILLGVVFTTGACVLVLEVLATRMLSPYFGNTIYTFSSVLGVVLASLSIGYAWGGRFADKHPHTSYFYRIILVGGATVLILAGANKALLPIIGYMLPIHTGPLFASLMLFTIPSLLLGMLSPFAIALRQQMADQGVGANAGSVYFWSTLGSITGSLLAGFALVPHLGISSSLIGTAVVLILLGLFGPLLHGQSHAKALSQLVLFVIASGFVSSVLFVHSVSAASIIYEREGVYQNIRVVDTTRYGRPIRILYQDRNASSGIYPNSDELAFEYSKFYRLGDQAHPNPEEALVIGAGAYSLPKAMLTSWQSATVDVLEIEPLLEEVAKEYFGLEDSPRLHTYITDGRRFLHDTEKRYDVIFGDAYSSHHAMPPHLTTVEFFSLVRDRLTDDGVLIVNFIGSTENKPQSVFLSALKTVTSAFPDTRIFASRDPLYTDTQNIVIVSAKSAEVLERICSNANTDPVIGELCGNEIPMNSLDLKEHRLLTDNYAPLEYLATFEI